MDVKLEVEQSGTPDSPVASFDDSAASAFERVSDGEDSEAAIDVSIADELKIASQDPDSVYFLSAPLLAVRCGDNKALLLREKFLCPGIHHKCIELNDQLLTPKEFTVISGKSRQKDWKGSIRIGKCTLRSLMENNYIDFHNHANQCSGKCQSRGGPSLTPKIKDEKEGSLFRGDAPTMVESSSAYDSIAATLSSLLSATTSNGTPNWARTSDIDPPLSSSSDLLKISDSFSSLDPAFGISSIPMPPLMEPGETSTSSPSEFDKNSLESMMLSRPQHFWTTISDIGMFDELVNEIVSTVYQMKNYFKNRVDMRSKMSHQLSKMIKLLGISPLIENKIRLKRMVQRAEGDKLNFQIEELRRKTEEHKQKQQMSRKRTELFDKLVYEAGDFDSANEEPPLKLPRNDSD